MKPETKELLEILFAFHGLRRNPQSMVRRILWIWLDSLLARPFVDVEHLRLPSTSVPAKLRGSVLAEGFRTDRLAERFSPRDCGRLEVQQIQNRFNCRPIHSFVADFSDYMCLAGYDKYERMRWKIKRKILWLVALPLCSLWRQLFWEWYFILNCWSCG